MLKSYSELPSPHVWALCIMACMLFATIGVTTSQVFGPPFNPVEYCLQSTSSVERCNEAHVLREEAAE
ncbi:hypothetical protein [Salipiger sp. PrR003]|uniref:hypothetical protein n=1 Tax=Salipiger sp. PrR003 TaxID=2706776 RepID=UPI0013DBA3AE|nr:hypothetical protein [Salipiger sp. PrR003]NDV50149.1 hypothetical protein [Salipiger sp. PrR003]